MNFQPSNLQDLEPIINVLLAEAKCACHIINPHKTRILMWKKIENGITIYTLRIGIQKFSSSEQLDRNGEVYWRYYGQEINPIKTEVSQDNEPATNQQSN